MKTLNLTLMMLMVSFVLSCQQKPEPTIGEPPPPVEPTNLISLDAAKKQLNFYKQAHPGVTGDEYALRTWISIEELENYIAFMKEESKKKGIKITGIDFIHTQYKEGKPGMKNELNKDYELTLMYAPTFDDNGKNVAFDPLNSKEGDPATLKSLLSSKSENDTIGNGDSAGKGGSGSSGIANKLNSCPNKCD